MPHCGSNRMPKDGHSGKKQTCRCGDCKYRYAPDGNRHYYPEKTIRQALDCRKERHKRVRHRPRHGDKLRRGARVD